MECRSEFDNLNFGSGNLTVTPERQRSGRVTAPRLRLRNYRGGVLAVFLAIIWFAHAIPANANEKIRQEIDCLALTMYFEARGEPDLGKLAVGHVVLNRVSDKGFPDEICDVVRQGGEKTLYRCQFSWWCDGLSDRPREHKAWRRSVALAYKLYWGYSDDPTYGALWYHADYVRPSWKKSFKEGPTIGRHIFYRKPNHNIPLQWASSRSEELF